MTNYNERLEDILRSLANKVEWCVSPELLSRATVDREREDEAIAEAKQAITSLIEELVAEAKPSKKRVGDEVAEPIEELYSVRFVSDKCRGGYLNKNKQTGNLFVSNYHERDDIQAKFTTQEIKDIGKKEGKYFTQFAVKVKE